MQRPREQHAPRCKARAASVPQSEIDG